MVDRRLVAVLLFVLGLGAGWGANVAFEKTVPPVREPAVGSSGRAALPPALPAAPPAVTTTPEEMRSAFEGIYRNAVWGRNGADAGTSGFGSALRTTRVYRTWLEEFLFDADIHSVVDAGCGDWTFSKAIDWKGIDYKGFDIVPSVIEKDKAAYTKANVHFFTANIVDDELPPADLIIVKQVLQHLPNSAVQRFLKQLPKYKHALIVEDVDSMTLSAKNVDIEPGAFRFLDVTRPPFNLKGAKLLSFWDGGNTVQALYVPQQVDVPQRLDAGTAP